MIALVPVHCILVTFLIAPLKLKHVGNKGLFYSVHFMIQ